MSKQLQISQITIRRAFQQLAEEGYLNLRQGSGAYVSSSHGKVAARNAGDGDAATFTIGRFEQSDFTIAFQISKSNEALTLSQAFTNYQFHPWWDRPVECDFRAYQPNVGDDSANKVTTISSTQKSEGALERHIADWLLASRNLSCSPEEITIIAGAQQARDLLARLFVSPGMKVAVQEPGSITDLLAYASKGADLVSLTTPASLMHVLSFAAFPAGTTLNDQERRELIANANAQSSLLVEDSYGAGYFYSEDPPQSLYGENARIIHVGTLSHVLGPAQRIGFIVAPRDISVVIRKAREALAADASAISKALALRQFENSGFETKFHAQRQLFRARRAALLAGLADFPSGTIEYSPVLCGFQQAVWFTKPVDDLLLFELALRAGVGIIPISPYFHREQPRSGMALAFTGIEESRIKPGLERLLQLSPECEIPAETESSPGFG